MIIKNKILTVCISGGIVLTATLTYLGFNLLSSNDSKINLEQTESTHKEPEEESFEEIPEVVPEQPQLKPETETNPKPTSTPEKKQATSKTQEKQEISASEKQNTAVQPKNETPSVQPSTPVLTTQNTNTNAASEVINFCNAERIKVGLAALSLGNDAMQKATNIRAEEIKTNFSHTRPNGSSFFSVLTENGVKYSTTGENIAWGQKTAKDVVSAWMNSEGHKANILNSKFTHICVGVSGTYWVQIFIG